MDPLAGYLSSRKMLVDAALDRYLPSPDLDPRAIHQCMRYSAEGGKRIRPTVALAVAEMFGCPVELGIPTGAAIELIHTHSLILDDLPCMDDDDYRRGRPASHRQFGEGVALLAADALLNLAIALLGSNHRLSGIGAETALEIIREVGETVGTSGVIGGQFADLTYSTATGEGSALLERIHLGKTAKLFRLSARAGALVAGAAPGQVDAVGGYGEKLGLAFQIVDDLLDEAGEAPGGHGRKGEPSYASMHRPEIAREAAARASREAIAALAPFGDEAAILRMLAEHSLSRSS